MHTNNNGATQLLLMITIEFSSSSSSSHPFAELSHVVKAITCCLIFSAYALFSSTCTLLDSECPFKFMCARQSSRADTQKQIEQSGGTQHTWQHNTAHQQQNNTRSCSGSIPLFRLLVTSVLSLLASSVLFTSLLPVDSPTFTVSADPFHLVEHGRLDC